MKKGEKMKDTGRLKVSRSMQGNRNAEGNDGGRPTKYGVWATEKAKAYLKRCKDVNLPSIAGLCKELGVHRQTVTAWSALHPEFSDLVQSISLEQEIRLVNGGLSGRYNAGMARFVLSAHHGYSETMRQEVRQITEDDLSQMTDEELRRIANGE